MKNKNLIIACPKGRLEGGHEPQSRRWYDAGLEYAASDADADLRIVEITCANIVVVWKLFKLKL